jgi:hypothetical protein
MPISMSFNGGTRSAYERRLRRGWPNPYRTPSGTLTKPPRTTITTSVPTSSSSCMGASKNIAPNAELNRMMTGSGNSGEKTESDESLLQ